MTSAAPPTCDVTCLSAKELAREIAAGRLSSADVVETHIRRIEAVHARINALAVPLFDEARCSAERADAERRRGAPLGPLHGVPVTVKESFHVAGTPSSIGVRGLAAERFAEDGPLVRSLREAGAIILGKTNVPQLMLLHETDNPVYGRTNNPWDLERSPGGSSGGEAALVAAGGSALGLASDLGGSIRQPAHSCGVHGLKPTSGRLSAAGCRMNLRGMEAIGAPPGPIARSVADLELALRLWTAASVAHGDPRVSPAPLGESAAVRVDRLRIGMFTDDGYFSTAPAIRRAVDEAAAALAQLGAQVEAFSPPNVERMMQLYFGLISADGGADFRRLLGDSARDWRITRLLRIGGYPASLRGPLAWGLRWVGQRRLAELVRSTGAVSADGYWQLSAARADYTDRFMEAIAEARLDALIFPPHALPALRHGSSDLLPTAASCCFLPNLLGIPAGVVAATRVRLGEETDRAAGRDRVEQMAREVEVGSAGLPIGVQVAAPHWREDVVLAVMQVLESHFRGQSDYPARSPLE